MSYLGERIKEYSLIRLWGSIGFIITVAGVGWLLESQEIADLDDTPADGPVDSPARLRDAAAEVGGVEVRKREASREATRRRRDRERRGRFG